MYNRPVAIWALAVTPYGSPFDAAFGGPEESSQSPSTSFQTLKGSSEAQNYLQSVKNKPYLPPASELVRHPLWPRPPLLLQSRVHPHDFILSNLCQNIGVRTHRVAFPHGSDPEVYSFDMRADKLLSLEWNYPPTADQNGKWVLTSVEGTSTSESFHMEPEVFFRAYFGILEAKSADDVCTIRFSKRPIKKMNTVSLMPTLDEFRLMIEIEHESRNFSDVEIGQESNQFHMDSTFDPSANFDSYYSSKSSFTVDPPHHLEPEVPILTSRNPFADSDARSVDWMTNPDKTRSLSSHSQLNLLDLTPTIHAPLRYVTNESKLPPGSHNAERIHSTMERNTGVLNVDTDESPEFRIFGAAKRLAIENRTRPLKENANASPEPRNFGAANLTHHSGEEPVGTDVERALRFDTRRLYALDTDSDDQKYKAVTRADESRFSFNAVSARGTTAKTGKLNTVVDAHFESMSANELESRHRFNRDSSDSKDLIFSIDDDETLLSPVQADQHGILVRDFGCVQHTSAPKLPSPSAVDLPQLQASPVTTALLQEFLADTKQERELTARIAQLRASSVSSVRRRGRVQRTSASKPPSTRAVTSPPPRASLVSTAPQLDVRTGGSSTKWESAGLVFDALWRYVGMPPEPVWWVRLCFGVLDWLLTVLLLVVVNAGLVTIFLIYAAGPVSA